MTRFKFTVTPENPSEFAPEIIRYKVACEGHPLCYCSSSDDAEAVIDQLADANLRTIIDMAVMGEPIRVFVQSGAKRIGTIRPERWSHYDAAPIDYWTTTPYVRCHSEAAERAAAGAGYTSAMIFIEYGYGVRSRSQKK